MRNLKKILALVLALVMSLSLMATAGASSFSDVEAGNQYETAIDVLDALKVFQGYTDGTFRPDGDLTRAEAAVLVYRIATGDVDNKYVDNYTYMANSKFEDLDGYNWAKGYINYCQNAKIVVGTDATHFAPGGKVTGYQLMVMVLRALGYGEAGEFSDPKTWELKTASMCESMGMLKKVTTGDFGAPAKRAMVAEILFRGLLQETVTYSTFTSGGYTGTGETLGHREYGLEYVEGVVIANEYANLNGNSVLAANVTRMETAEGKIVNVNKSTDLDAVGQTYTAYVADGEGSTKRALTLEKSPVNVVAFNEGKAASVKDVAKKEGLSYADADYYINYKENWEDEATSEVLLRYSVTEASIKDGQTAATAKAWIEYLDGMVTAKKAVTKEVPNGDATTTEYTVSIRPNTKISTTDLAIMQEIFYTANDLYGKPTAKDLYVEGEVYAYTTEEDVSNTMSWKKFEDTFLDYGIVSKYEDVEMGNSLRVIDNNGDGKAEYIFKVKWTQDQVVASYKDELIFNKEGLSAPADLDLVVGDVVNYNWIDGRLTMNKAVVVTGTIEKKDWKNVTVTVKDGDTYDQSAIDNDTTLSDNILLMDDTTTYNMYLDEYANIRTYGWVDTPDYALLTEMYPTNSQNWNYVKAPKFWAEVVIGDEKPNEYITSDNVFRSNDAWSQRLTKESNVKLAGDYNFLQPAIAHLGYNTYNGNEYLGWALSSTKSSTAWNRDTFEMAAYPVDTTPAPWDGFYGVFAYPAAPNNGIETGTCTDDDGNDHNTTTGFTFTNVARYVLNDDESVSLSTASVKYVDKNGDYLFYGRDKKGDLTKKTAEEWAAYNKAEGLSYDKDSDIKEDNGYYYVYAVDYVQLKNADFSSGNRHFYIDDNYSGFYDTISNDYVDALDTTEFFIVYPSEVKHYVGYRNANLPALDRSTIRATYAVAQNTQSDDRDHDYWTADVIVIEVEKDAVNHARNVGLLYCNPFEVKGSVRYVNSLYANWVGLEAADPDITVIPEGNSTQFTWGNKTWADEYYGFYDLDNAGKADYNAEKDELTVSSADQIPCTFGMGYNAHNIYAGVITRMERVTDSHYLDVDVVGRMSDVSIDLQWKNNDDTVNVPFYKITGTGAKTSAKEILALTDAKVSDVQKGDFIIVVGSSLNGNRTINSASYIVDLGNANDLVAATVKSLVDEQLKSVVNYKETPAWLWDIFQQIAIEQGADPVADALIALAEELAAKDVTKATEADVEYAEAVIKALDEAKDYENRTDETNEALDDAAALLQAWLDEVEASEVRAKVMELLAAFAAENDIDTDSDLYKDTVAAIEALGSDVEALEGLMNEDQTELNLDAETFEELKEAVTPEPVEPNEPVENPAPVDPEQPVADESTPVDPENDGMINLVATPGKDEPAAADEGENKSYGLKAKEGTKVTEAENGDEIIQTYIYVGDNCEVVTNEDAGVYAEPVVDTQAVTTTDTAASVAWLITINVTKYNKWVDSLKNTEGATAVEVVDGALASVLTVTIVIVMPTCDLTGANVTVLTGSAGNAIVSNAEEVEVTVNPGATLTYAAADSSVGRMYPGWWVGINVTAPTGLGPDAVFCNTDGELKSFAAKKDGEWFMQCWGGILEDWLASDRTTYTYKWYFNWDGDDFTGKTYTVNGVEVAGVDQVITMTFDLSNTKLMKEGTQIWPAT